MIAKLVMIIMIMIIIVIIIITIIVIIIIQVVIIIMIIIMMIIIMQYCTKSCGRNGSRSINGVEVIHLTVTLTVERTKFNKVKK